jgi:hypothetical protein
MAQGIRMKHHPVEATPFQPMIMLTLICDDELKEQCMLCTTKPAWAYLTSYTAILLFVTLQVVCEELKIQSQNDTAKLAEAKQRVYLKVRKYSSTAVTAHSSTSYQTSMAISPRMQNVCHMQVLNCFALLCFPSYRASQMVS